MRKQRKQNVQTCCPKCGGTTGIGDLVRVEKRIGSIGWANHDLDYFDFDSLVSESKRGKCLDCGKSVKIPEL